MCYPMKDCKKAYAAMEGPAQAGCASNGADRRNPGTAVTKGMKADFSKRVDGRAEKVTVLKRNIKNYLNKK